MCFLIAFLLTINESVINNTFIYLFIIIIWGRGVDLVLYCLFFVLYFSYNYCMKKWNRGSRKTFLFCVLINTVQELIKNILDSHHNYICRLNGMQILMTSSLQQNKVLCNLFYFYFFITRNCKLYANLFAENSNWI